MRTISGLLAFGFVFGLAGCSAGLDMALETGATTFEPGTLIAHVYPTSDSGLLPQTFVVVPQVDGYGFIDLDLAQTVNLTGTLTALLSHPWNAVNAPTTAEPFAGSIQVVKPGTVQSAAVRPDSEGLFSLQVPAGPGYQLYLTPDDPTISPASGEAGLNFGGDQDLSREIAAGVPIFGRITAAGVGVGSAPLALTRLEPGPQATSAAFYTDDDGWFVARAPGPGSYVITVQSGLSVAGAVLPSAQGFVTVAEDGGSVNIDLGKLAAAVLTGTIVDEAGDPVRDAQVKLRSSTLDDVSGSVEVTATTDANGSYVARLIPGQFTAEVLPAYESTWSPTSVPMRVEAGSNDMGIIALSGWQTVNGVVNLPGGGQAANVSVTATQVGWSNYAYSTTTDALGAYTLNLPATDFAVECSPASDSGAAVTRVDLPLGGDPSIMLVAGALVQGVVKSEAGVTAYAVIEIRDAATDSVLGTAMSGDDGTFSLSVDLPTEPIEGAGDTGDTGDTGGDTGDTGGDTGTDTGAADTGA